MNNYSEEEYEIFSRLFILKEFSEENLKKLSNIKIGKVLPSSSALVKAGLSAKRRSCLNHITFIFFANAIIYI